MCTSRQTGRSSPPARHHRRTPARHLRLEAPRNTYLAISGGLLMCDATHMLGVGGRCRTCCGAHFHLEQVRAALGGGLTDRSASSVAVRAPRCGRCLLILRACCTAETPHGLKRRARKMAATCVRGGWNRHLEYVQHNLLCCSRLSGASVPPHRADSGPEGRQSAYEKRRRAPVHSTNTGCT